MWLSAMSDLTAAFFGLLTLLLWTRKRHLAALPAFCAALFSKESALVLPLLAWILDRRVLGQRTPLNRWLLLALPAAAGAGLLLWTLPRNNLVSAGYYQFGPSALPVLAASLFKLAWPWLFVLLALSLLQKPGLSRGERLPIGSLSWLAVWTAAALLPFLFLTYQGHVPSRHLYLASAGCAMLLALWLENLTRPAWRTAFLAAFLAVNPAYLWLRKDAQYEERAAPTTRLVELLRRTPPQPLSVAGFPYNPWVGRLSARLAPGWQPEMLTVNDIPGTQPPQLRLRWTGEAYERE